MPQIELMRGDDFLGDSGLRPTVYYNGTVASGQIWDGSGTGSASGAVTVDLCALRARSFTPVRSHAPGQARQLLL